MTMTRRRLLDDTFKKSVVGNPAIATDSLARMYPGIVMNGWTTQDGTPTPEAPVPIISAGTQNQDTGKWKYEVEVECGNLINESDAMYNENYFTYENGKFTCVSGASTYVWFEKILSAGGYFWSVNCDEISGSGKIQVRNQSNEILFKNTFSDPGKKNLIFTLEETTECRLLFGGNSNSAITFSKPMLNPGTTALPYTPYRPPQTVTLTADRPLTKWDKLTKKNGVWGWEYGSGIYTVTGEEIFYSSYAAYKGDETSDAWFKNDEMVQRPSSNTQIGYCEQLSWSALMWLEANDGKIGFTFNNYQIHMRLRNSDIGINAEDTLTDVSNKIKAYAAQKYQEGNPFIFLYETKEPVFVPLSETEHEQMNALHTNRPTTVLSNNQDCEMTLTYKTKKSMGGNLLDYRKLINLDKWSPVGSAYYRHFDISFKPKTTYKISVSVNNMHKGYKKDYIGKFALYLGETPDSPDNNFLFGNTNVDTVSTEYTFTTSENPFYLNLYVLTWSSEYLHIVFDELLPNIRLEEVVT